MLFKVTFDKEIHILKSLNAKTLKDLKGMVPKVFKVFPENFYLTYIDEDGDQGGGSRSSAQPVQNYVGAQEGSSQGGT